MHLPITLMISEGQGTLLFGDATPSQIKSKGRYFNRGDIRTVDNLIRNLRVNYFRGATGRGSSTVTVSLTGEFGNDSDSMEHTIYITAQEFMPLMNQDTIVNGELQGTYVAVFSGMRFTLERYRAELFEKANQKDEQKEIKKEQRRQERKERRERNKELLERIEIGDTIEFNGNKLIYLGEQYVSYRRANAEDLHNYTTKKAHIAFGRRRRYTSQSEVLYELVTLDLGSLELTETKEPLYFKLKDGRSVRSKEALKELVDENIMNTMHDRQGSRSRTMVKALTYHHIGTRLALTSLKETKEESVIAAKEYINGGWDRSLSVNRGYLWYRLTTVSTINNPNTKAYQPDEF